MNCVRPFLVSVLLALLPTALAGQQPTQPQQAPRYKQLTPGILASEPVFVTDSLPRYHVEIRDLVMGPKQTAPTVPLDGFAFMELRSGSVEVTVNGKSTRREAGSSWFVPRGARIAIRNLGEVAIMRTSVLTPR